jgi:hypothetical protein
VARLGGTVAEEDGIFGESVKELEDGKVTGLDLLPEPLAVQLNHLATVPIFADAERIPHLWLARKPAILPDAADVDVPGIVGIE